jgi:hypothetical protein
MRSGPTPPLLVRPSLSCNDVTRLCSALSAWPSKDPDAVRYLDFCATTVSSSAVLATPCVVCHSDTQQVSSSSQPISVQPAAAASGGSQGMQPGSRRPSSSAASASSSAAAAKKTAKSSREMKAATSLGSSSQNHGTPPAPHPSSFSGGRSLLPPAPPRSQPQAQSARASAAASLPVCSVEIGAFHIGNMRTARMACFTPRVTRSQAASMSTLSCSGSVKR